MKTAKFWLVQIAMVAIVSLIFGSPVFAGPPDQANGVGAETSDTAHNNHSGGKAQAGSHANGNAAFMGDVVEDPVPDPVPDPTDCGDGYIYIEGIGCVPLA